MAMRPDVKRHSVVMIVFAIAQWVIVLYGLNNNLFPLDKSGRILAFCASAFVGAWVLMASLLYMVIKGRDRSRDNEA
ncbi:MULTISPECIES: hypothetical protein [unclassified Acinetobacter]|uniref:hypothetical protein n=1 Tax=unclassified Acinetobacter TaxID=196816 RepID=UPI0035BB586D